MTLSPNFEPAFGDLDDRFNAPWAATGVISSQDARLFAAACASDPALDDDLAAARAEYAAVSAMGDALGRPSMRPLLQLFAAIDRETLPVASNVTRLIFARERLATDIRTRVGRESQKFVRRR